jgi:hypothetical protein
MIPCYAADGTSLGYRPLDAAQSLVAGGHVRPAYGRKGHLRAIWLLRDDGTSPVQGRAHGGTQYSFIEMLEHGRCWQLRRLDRPDDSPVSARDPFVQVVRDCIVTSPDSVGERPSGVAALPQACSHAELSGNVGEGEPGHRTSSPIIIQTGRQFTAPVLGDLTGRRSALVGASPKVWRASTIPILV